MPNSLRARLKNLVHKGILTQKDLDRIVIMPADEAKNKKLIPASEYEKWGKFCDEEYEELDFVQQRKKIGVNLVPCEDAISRQAVLDLCERFDGCVPYSVLSNNDILPSISAEKTGRWTPYCYQNYECSICGYIISESDYEEFNFCPNCGAKMEVEK